MPQFCSKIFKVANYGKGDHTAFHFFEACKDYSLMYGKRDHIQKYTEAKLLKVYEYVLELRIGYVTGCIGDGMRQRVNMI